jgi:hypothetical protein
MAGSDLLVQQAIAPTLQHCVCRLFCFQCSSLRSRARLTGSDRVRYITTGSLVATLSQIST